MAAPVDVLAVLAPTTRLVGVRAFVVVEVAGLSAKLPKSPCFWCGTQDHVCSVCANRANRVRVSLARTAAKRDARCKGAQP